MKSKSFFIFIICSLLFLNSACQKKEAAKKMTAQAAPKIILSLQDIVQVNLSQVFDSFKATGELKPILESAISSEVEGVALRVYVEAGDHVKAGQLLATLDSKDLRDQLTTSQESLQKAIARANLSKTTLSRKNQAYKEDLIAKQEVDVSSTDHQVNLREVESTKAQVSLAKTALQKANVKAPVNGIVSQKLIKTGELAQPGKTLFEIVQINPLKVELAVPNKYLSAVKVGQPVELKISSLPDEVFKAKVTKINPVADEATRSVILTAEVPNPQEKLKANLFVNSEIKLTQPRQGFVIPREAVQKDLNDKLFVYIFDANENKVTRKRIVAEPMDAESTQYEVKEGLEKGDNLVIVPLNIDSSEAEAKIQD